MIWYWMALNMFLDREKKCSCLREFWSCLSPQLCGQFELFKLRLKPKLRDTQWPQESKSNTCNLHWPETCCALWFHWIWKKFSAAAVHAPNCQRTFSKWAFLNLLLIRSDHSSKTKTGKGFQTWCGDISMMYSLIYNILFSTFLELSCHTGDQSACGMVPHAKCLGLACRLNSAKWWDEVRCMLSSTWRPTFGTSQLWWQIGGQWLGCHWV